MKLLYVYREQVLHLYISLCFIMRSMRFSKTISKNIYNNIIQICTRLQCKLYKSHKCVWGLYCKQNLSLGTNNHWNQFWIVRICTVSHVKCWFYLAVQSGASMRDITPPGNPVVHRTLQKIKNKRKLLRKMCTFLLGTFKIQDVLLS